MKHVQHPENSGKGQSAPLPQPECPGEHCALWMALWDWDCLEIGEAPNDEEAAVLRPHYPAEPREGEAAPASGQVQRDDVRCTGWEAVWCPLHGNCRCPYVHDREELGRTRESQSCPLHADWSEHGGPHGGGAA